MMASLKFPLQDSPQQVASVDTTTISSKLICFNKQTDLFIQHLLEIVLRVPAASVARVVVNEEAIGSVPKGLTRDRLCADKEKELIGSVPMETKKTNVGRSTRQ